MDDVQQFGVDDLKIYIPIISAFIGAAFGSLLGAYFTFVSKKRERVWTEKFEALKEIAVIIGIIKDTYEIEHLQSMKVNPVSEQEYTKLNQSMRDSKIRLRQQAASLKVLLKTKDLLKFEELVFSFNISVRALRSWQPEDDLTGLIEDVWEAADNLQKETIDMAEKHCQ